MQPHTLCTQLTTMQCHCFSSVVPQATECHQKHSNDVVEAINSLSDKLNKLVANSAGDNDSTNILDAAAGTSNQSSNVSDHIQGNGQDPSQSKPMNEEHLDVSVVSIEEFIFSDETNTSPSLNSQVQTNQQPLLMQQ